MKLLDWMQHKFRQTNNDHVTEFTPRSSCACITDLQYYGSKSHSYVKLPKVKPFRKSFACMEAARADNEHQDDQQDSSAQLFHGFLAIGTLATTEPETPTFATSAEKITWKETEATENELNLINGELQKVLGTEEKEDKEEGGDKKEDGGVVCPLQNYLFNSVIGLPETSIEKKEHRASLGELFQRTKMEEKEYNGPKNDAGEKKTEKSAVHLMKKILKGRALYPSSRRSIDSASADKKPGKLQRMFNRKVHPEGPKSEDVTLFPLVDTSKNGANLCMSDSDGNRECWIKSDTEYLVLEVKG